MFSSICMELYLADKALPRPLTKNSLSCDLGTLHSMNQDTSLKPCVLLKGTMGADTDCFVLAQNP